MKTIIAVIASITLACCSAPPRAGDECEVSVCGGPTTGLACASGKLEEVSCGGGCSDTSTGIECDPRGASAGEPCSAQLLGLSTCSGERQVLTCFSRIWQVTDECSTLCVTDSSGLDAKCVK